MGKGKHSKAMSFLHLSQAAWIYTIPKTSEKWTIVREKYGKKIFKNDGFLKCFVLRWIPITLKTWDKWIAILWERYQETQTFQNHGFLTSVARNRKSYNSQDVRKVNFYNKWTTRKNTSIPKLTGQAWENRQFPSSYLLHRFWVV